MEICTSGVSEGYGSTGPFWGLVTSYGGGALKSALGGGKSSSWAIVEEGVCWNGGRSEYAIKTLQVFQDSQHYNAPDTFFYVQTEGELIRESNKENLNSIAPTV